MNDDAYALQNAALNAAAHQRVIDDASGCVKEAIGRFAESERQRIIANALDELGSKLAVIRA